MDKGRMTVPAPETVALSDLTPHKMASQDTGYLPWIQQVSKKITLAEGMQDAMGTMFLLGLTAEEAVSHIKELKIPE